MHNKIVSIIIPAYCAENTIADTIDSILAQTYSDWEAIVVNDGSVDGTEDIVRKISITDSRIKLFNQNNKGAQNARNVGLSNSIGKYVKCLDSDDSLCPDILERQVELAERSPDSVIYSDWQNVIYNYSNEIVGKQFVSREIEESPVLSLVNGEWSPPFAYLFLRRHLETIGGFDEIVTANQDYDTIIRIAMMNIPFIKCMGVAGYYNNYMANRVSGNKKEWAKSTEYILDRIIPKLPMDRVDYQNAVCKGYLLAAKEIYRYDIDAFRRIIEKVKGISLSYKGEGAVYRSLVSIIGFENAEKLCEMKRRVKRIYDERKKKNSNNNNSHI